MIAEFGQKLSFKEDHFKCTEPYAYLGFLKIVTYNLFTLTPSTVIDNCNNSN